MTFSDAVAIITERAPDLAPKIEQAIRADVARASSPAMKNLARMGRELYYIAVVEAAVDQKPITGPITVEAQALWERLTGRGEVAVSPPKASKNLAAIVEGLDLVRRGIATIEEQIQGMQWPK